LAGHVLCLGGWDVYSVCHLLCGHVGM
jgi:hypothetical protein